MKNIYKNSSKNLNKAKKLLRKNNIIVVPTETVYGLAGNAYSNSSIKKIYKLKKRPKINPLIIHYSNIDSVKKDAYLDDKSEILSRRVITTTPGIMTSYDSNKILSC